MAQEGAGSGAHVRELGNTTFPRLLLKHARERSQSPAMREKDLGIWQTWTWAQLRRRGRALAAGLARAGFQARRAPRRSSATTGRGFTSAMMAAQCARRHAGADVPGRGRAARWSTCSRTRRSPTRSSRTRSRSTSCSRSASEYPPLEHIYLRRSARPAPLHAAGLLPLRRSCSSSAQRPAAGASGIHRRRDRQGFAGRHRGDVLHLGHHRQAQGRVQTHAALIAVARSRREMEELTADEEVLAYLPMAWIGQNIFSYAQALVTGFTVNCPESPATVITDMREIGPTYYFAPPRVFEGAAHAGDDPHGGRRPRSSAGCSTTSWTWRATRRRPDPRRRQPVGLGDRLAVRARRPAGLRAAAQRARHEPGARRLYRRRGDRPGPVRVLPLASAST